MHRKWVVYPAIFLLLLSTACQKKQAEDQEFAFSAVESKGSYQILESPKLTLTLVSQHQTETVLADLVHDFLVSVSGLKIVQTQQLPLSGKTVHFTETGKGMEVLYSENGQTVHQWLFESADPMIWDAGLQVVSELSPLLEIQPPKTSSPPGTIQSKWLEAKRTEKSDNLESMNRAVELYKSILKEDASFFPAWTALADIYIRRYDQDHHMTWLNLAGESAVRIDNAGVLDGPVLLADIAYRQGDWKKSFALYKKAIANTPYLTRARLGIGSLLLMGGLYPDAERELQRAAELSPESGAIWTELGWAYLGLNQNIQAVESFERVQNINPGERAQAGLALALCRLHKPVEALELLEKGDASPLMDALKVNCYIERDMKDEALGLLEMHVTPQTENDPGLAMAAASGYALLGRPGEAVIMLRKADQAGYYQYPWIMADPFMEAIRSDSRNLEQIQNIKKRWQQRTTIFTQ